MEEGTFAITRRTWIDPEGNRWGKKQWAAGLQPNVIKVLKGMPLILHVLFPFLIGFASGAILTSMLYFNTRYYCSYVLYTNFD
jgi:hypothetical protein